MTTYVRNGGAWTQAQPRVRCGGEWKAGNLYTRCDGEWKLVYDVSEGTLLAPTSFAASGTDHNSTTLTWTNPTQTGGTPTQIQIRLAQLGSIWTELDPTETSWAHSALDPSTEYLAQIRYIIRTNGIITGTSPIADVTFTTDAAPIGAPAEDPGGTGGDTIVPFTGTTTNPTNPSTAFGTWWEWKLELLSETAISWSTPNPPNTVLSDDGASQIYGELAGNGTQVSWSDGDLTAGRTYRVCRREVEDTTGNATADTFGTWVCGDPFPAPADWDAACAGATGSSAVTGSSVAGDLTFRFPDMCVIDGEMVMREAVSGVQVIKGAGFFAHFTSADDEEGAAPLTTQTSSPFLPTMAVPVGTTVTKGSDWSVGTNFRALAAFSGVDGRSYRLFDMGGGAIKIDMAESATGWTPTASVLADGGGFVTLTGSEIPYDSGFTHNVVISWDADGTKSLIVDGSTVDTDTGTDIYETLASSAGVVVSAPAYLMNLQQYGIDQALTESEASEMIDIWATATAVTYNYVSNAKQTWTVPSGVTRARFTMWGARGGNASDTFNVRDSFDGVGRKIRFVLNVTPSDVYDLYVPSQGGKSGGVTGGWPGGGAGGLHTGTQDNHGGGGSARLFPAGLSGHGDVIAVAGAGGGAGEQGGADGARCVAGDGGPIGGTAGAGYSGNAGGGGGGSQVAGGAAGGGSGQSGGSSGSAGSAFSGGAGSNGGGGSFDYAGGGGGSGYYGGGGGEGGNAYGFAGGGGSSYVDSGVATDIEDLGVESLYNGTSGSSDFGNGRIYIEYL